MGTGMAKGTAARRLLAGLTSTADSAPIIRPVSRAAGSGQDRAAGTGAGQAAAGDAPAGLRERKKQRTRITIVDAAHALFAQCGYDATTIDAIALRADVSVRTFFRYFASKEEVALAPLDEVGELALAALDQRPAHEPPLAALRAAALDAWAAMAPQPAAFHGYVEHLLIANGAPAVSGAMLQRMVRLGDRLAAAIAPRFPAQAGPVQSRGIDLRPELTAAAFLAAVQVGVRAWFTRGSRDLGEMLAMVEFCIDQLVPADSAHPTPDRKEPARPGPAGADRHPTPAPTAAQPTGPPANQGISGPAGGVGAEG